MPFRRKRKQTIGRVGIKHADTLMGNIGPASAVTKFPIIESEGGLRTESEQTIQANATTGEVCRTGDLVKYVNIHIQSASRTLASIDQVGWLEYACVWKREGETDITNTTLGTLTLGTACTNLFRNDCIWTGFIPIFENGAFGAELHLKMPQTKQFLKLGEEFVLYLAFRSTISTDTGTANNRFVASFNYKAYS